MKHTNKLLSILLTVCLIVGLVPWTAMGARAEGGVSYLDATGTQQTCETYTTLQDNSPDSWSTGWYVLKQDSTISSYIGVTGNVHLILCDGATLTAEKGIRVNEGNSLTIYAQSTGGSMGALTATGNNNAGIGGGNLKAGGTITINGGKIAATGYDGSAGIGGGWEGAGGTVTINGGVVTATGSNEDGRYGGAGIGGGKKGAGGTVTINGGTVNAAGGNYAACIGGGYNGDGGTIRLLGGQIAAPATDSGQTGVGAGYGGSTASITLGWAKADDFIDVSDSGSWGDKSYSGTVTVAEGKRFLATKTKTDGYDGGVISAGSVNYGDMNKIRNARLTPVAGYLVNTDGDAVANKPFYAQGDTVTLTPKAGYSFTAVTVTKADGTVEVSVAEGGGSATFTMPGEDVTVTATLAGNAYTVRFNANGGGGTMDSQSFVYGTEQPLALCAFTPPDGKTFDCWATKADGSGTTYANAQSVSTLTTEAGGVVPLYAQWKTATEWDALQALIDNAKSGGTVQLGQDYTAVEGDKDLTVRKALTLDLNGHVVDGASFVRYILTVTDGAALTIIDSDSNAIHDGLSYTDPIDDTTIVPITGGALVRAGCGLYIECGTATLQGGTIALNSSYGVDVAALGNDQGSFVLDGGTVCGNQCSGIYCNLGPATIKSGTVCGNSDGGLNVTSKWTTTMTGGTISGNCGGPGVALYGSASFEMFGGKITGNKASYYSGAGVYMDSTSTKLTMSGGEITGNHATSRYSSTGAGVYATGQFRVSGKVTVSGNTAGENNEPCDVFLSYNPSIPTAPNDHPFLVDGALDPASRIGFAGSYRFGGNYDVLPTLATYGLREENRANALDIFFLNDRLNATVSDCRLALYDGELYLTKSAYTITFDPDGGSEVTAQAVPQNKLAGGSTIQTYDPAKAVAVRPADPTREGCSFLGWTLNGEAYDFATPVTGDVTLKAKWTVAQPSLTGGAVTAPAGAVLIVASYDTHGRMTSVRSVSAPADGWVGVPIEDIAPSAGFTLPDTYKLFLVNGETYAPLCEAWEKKA